MIISKSKTSNSSLFFTFLLCFLKIILVVKLAVLENGTVNTVLFLERWLIISGLN